MLNDSCLNAYIGVVLKPGGVLSLKGRRGNGHGLSTPMSLFSLPPKHTMNTVKRF